MAVASPLNLGRTSSFRTTRQGISNAGKSIQNISGILFRKTKVRRESIATSNLLTRKKIENENRAERETEAEAQKLVKSPIGRQSLANNTGGSFLDRIIGFIGYTALGWFMNNIPTWIGLGKEFIARLQKAGQIISSIANDTIRIVNGFGNVLGAIGKNIVSFDIFDNSKRLETALNDLNAAFFDMNQQFMDGFDLVGTPLTEAKYSGENIPEFGTEITEPGAYPETPMPSGGGGTVSPQAVYSYLRQLGVSDIHALGILANIQGESGFQVGVSEKGGGGVGLFQYTYPSRKSAFLRAVPDYKTNWKGQIDFAIKSDPNTPLYLRKQFSSPEEAADDFMRNWENPNKRVYAERRRKHNSFIRSFKAGKTQPPQAQVSQSTSVRPIITSRYGDPRGGRTHGGTDLATNYGTPLRAVADGKIIETGWESGWGYFLVYRDTSGLYHLYGHMPKGSFKTSGTVKKGEVIGKVGSTGRTSGPHLHWEIGKSWNGTIGGKFDPLKVYSANAPFNNTSSSGASAQVASTPSLNIPQQITPQRTAQDIFVFSPEPQTQMPTPAPSRGGQTFVGPDEFTTLNNFIKKQLLLDLVYL